MEDFPVVFTIDKNYVMPLCVTLASLYKQNKDKRLKVYVIHNNLDYSDERNILKTGEIFGKKIDFIKIDDNQFSTYKSGFHFTNAIFFRLLIPEIFVDKFEKVLYIDADALVLDDISEIFKVELGQNYLGAVQNLDFNRYDQLGLKKENKYFASGTLIINIPRWHQDRISDKIFNYLKNNNEVLMPDQDALNVIIGGKWENLGFRYGVETSLIIKVKSKAHKYRHFKQFIEKPAIVHFSGSSKPWHYANKHPFRNVFWEYLGLTPFRDFQYTDRNLKTMIERFLPNWFLGLYKTLTRKNHQL